MPDYNRPILKGDNRDEYILVKYTGCIKNVGELLYKAARIQSNFKSYWLDKYPKFCELDGKSHEEVFNYLAPFTGPEFLKYMCVSQRNFGMYTIEESMQDYARLRSLMNPFLSSVTNMELTLRNIASYDFCKKIYIHDVAFSDLSKKFLQGVFTKNPSKISLLEYDMKTILEEKPEITTIISDSAGEVCEFLQVHDQDKEILEKKQFMISSLPNVNMSSINNEGKITYKYEKFLSEAFDRFKCGVQWWQLKYETSFEHIYYPHNKYEEIYK